MTIADPIEEGLRGGWKVVDASRAERDVALDADVAIVGTGAGGGTAAEILARAGLRVVLLEEGPLRSSRDFRMQEREAYPDLYQESASRKTADKAINILQGRCVGGGTTVNWTSSFRTPPATLAFWEREYGLRDFSSETMAPWFERMEARLSIAPWTVAPTSTVLPSFSTRCSPGAVRSTTLTATRTSSSRTRARSPRPLRHMLASPYRRSSMSSC